MRVAYRPHRRVAGKTRAVALVAITAIAAVSFLACAADRQPSGFRPTATVEELMRTMIDPAADAVWDAVVIDATPEGVVEIVPETDGDWVRLRRHAVTLAESANLLLVEGRRVAAPTSRSELPGIDLHPDAIQTLVEDDWTTWAVVSRGLYDTSQTLLEAIDARDVDALLTAGTELDLACEACHAVFWYPGYADPRPAATDDMPPPPAP